MTDTEADLRASSTTSTPSRRCSTRPPATPSVAHGRRGARRAHARQRRRGGGGGSTGPRAGRSAPALVRVAAHGDRARSRRRPARANADWRASCSRRERRRSRSSARARTACPSRPTSSGASCSTACAPASCGCTCCCAARRSRSPGRRSEPDRQRRAVAPLRAPAEPPRKPSGWPPPTPAGAQRLAGEALAGDRGPRRRRSTAGTRASGLGRGRARRRGRRRSSTCAARSRSPRAAGWTSGARRGADEPRRWR